MAHWQNKLVEFIYRQATMREKHHRLITFLFGLFFFCMLLCTILLALVSDKLLGLPAWPSSPANLIPALALLAAGIWFWLWSAMTFFQSRGTPVPVSPPPQLVETGPYACSRNPMLSGVFLLLFGCGFLLQSLSLIIIFTPLFMGITFLELKMIEEPELEKRLGPPYKEYKKRVPMFFPYPGHGKN